MRILIPSSTLVALALLTTTQPASAQNAPFCLKSVSGATNCIYQSMAQCEQIKIPNSADQCLSATQVGTVGQGGDQQSPPTQIPSEQRQPGSQVPGGGLPPAER